MIRLRSSLLFAAASVAALLSFGPDRSVAASAPRVFRAGAATSNVTPPLGTSINGGFQDGKAVHIHDELHARCLALDDGTTKLVLVVVDNCVIGRDVFDAAKRQVQQATGLPPENMLMSATHAHSCGTLQAVGQSEPDPAYQTFVAQRIADGVRRALSLLAPAKIGWGYGEVPQHVFNRRWHLKPGTMPLNPFGNTSDQVKMNPGVGNPNLVRPAGPTDPQVWFISVQNAAGRPLALYANYSLHYVGGVGPGHISADYFGAFADRIQELLGADRQDPPFVGLMSNGTSGDINNINFRGDPARKPPYAQIRLVANDVAQEVARVARTLPHHDWVPLGVAQREVQLGLRIPDRDTVAKASAVMKGSKAYPRMLTSEEVYAREAVLLADFPAQVSAPLQVMKIGDLRVSAIPAEVFVEIGLELKKRHPQTFTVSLANAYHGYLPTPEQHRLGGYETWRARSACLEVDASPKIVAGLEELFARLK
jgi:neutral ceramidase